jgi:hypothetical protein
MAASTEHVKCLLPAASYPYAYVHPEPGLTIPHVNAEGIPSALHGHPRLLFAQHSAYVVCAAACSNAPGVQNLVTDAALSSVVNVIRDERRFGT